jgi:hypothetical protein
VSAKGHPIRNIAGVVLCGFLLSGCLTTVRRHPDFEQRMASISTVAVIPPEVQIVEIAFKGDNKRLTDEEEAIEHCLTEAVERQLRILGFTVKKSLLDEEHFEEDSDLRFETTQIKEAFGKALDEMYEKEQMWKSKARKYERSLGPDVNRFADHAEVDALVFSRMLGFSKSGGEQAKDVFMAVAIGVALGAYVQPAPSEGLILQVALVDGTTGDILWANTASVVDNYNACTETSMLKALLKKLKE